MEFTALRLFGFAISAALQFSLLTFIFIRRNRRLEKLETLFLSLIACLFCWNFANFLLPAFERTATDLSRVLLSLVVAPAAFGVLAFLPPLLLHIHLVFQSRVLRKPVIPVSRALEWALYLPLIALPAAIADFLPSYHPSKSILVVSRFSEAYAVWFCFALLVSAFLEWKMLRQSEKREDRALFGILLTLFLVVTGLVVYTYFIQDQDSLEPGHPLETVLMLWSVVPSALLGYFIFRHNFLEIAIQRSFGYPFAGVLLLLVYLVSVRYLPDFLGEIPKEVVQAGMILVLLPLLQPLRRWIDHSIENLFSREIDRFERLASGLDVISRSTVDLNQLLRLTEERLRKELNIKSIRLTVNDETDEASDTLARNQNCERILLQKGDLSLGAMLVEGHNATVPSEQHAALRYVIPQIVAAIETCRLVEGKIQLERELAERTRLASLGQMAATVAHNIKNPLSSIKTIVQLMQEDGELAIKYGQDLSLIKSEIDRLTESVTQLLRFSKPTVTSLATVDLGVVLEKILLIFRPDAERRNIRLHLQMSEKSLWVRGTQEVFLEVFQNLLVNALEVSRQDSAVVVHVSVTEGDGQRRVVVQVEDEGPGVPVEIQPKVFLPFFTTKQKGTGLGLAVVQRRVMDLAGEVTCVSPISAKGGTRFEVTLPLVEDRGLKGRDIDRDSPDA
jgi:signal transduction histidine kinase